MVFWVQTQIASKCNWKPVTNVNQPICMENAHQTSGLCNFVLITSSLLPSNDFQGSKSWKNCVQGYVLKLAIKSAIHAALKEEAKDKAEESGLEDGSV